MGVVGKVGIVVEECDETLFWLELIHSINFTDNSKVDPLIAETRKLLVIFAKTKKAARTSKNKL